MHKLRRIGALDLAEAISQRFGSYVDMNFLQFVAVEGHRIQCWYMNGGGEGPSFQIEIFRAGADWTFELIEHPPGTEQTIEVP